MSDAASVKMVVNADDFGYFEGVSRGILHCIDAGVVTATGVMANGPAFASLAGELAKRGSVSAGVHLNATLGTPLTAPLRALFAGNGGEFPSKVELALGILRGRIAVAAIVDEWRAQVRRCIDAGLRLMFLNSHEHVHALPALYRGVTELAREFAIAHVRRPRGEWHLIGSVGGLLRSAALDGARLLLPRARSAEPRLIGLGPSGRLDLVYCRKKLGTLSRGSSYELMCHPGWSDPEASRHDQLTAYHDWELELQTLTSPEFAGLLRRHAITLVPYAGLSGACE